MNISIVSLCFGSKITGGGSTANWGTELGQSQTNEQRITRVGAADLLLAMDYCHVPFDNFSCTLGNGRNRKQYTIGQDGMLVNANNASFDDEENSANESENDDIDESGEGEDQTKYQLIKSAVFENVSIEVKGKNLQKPDIYKIDKPFALYICKQCGGDHNGRRTLKYPKSLKIGDKANNRVFYDEVCKKIGEKACWFAHAINVKNQNELIISIIKVSEEIKTYQTKEERKKDWMRLFDSVEGRNSLQYQTIFYGVPGCGKSKQINDIINQELSDFDNKEYHKVRCVFHPEYSNADFVGQIYPYVLKGGGVDYRFKPGPFAKVIRRAYEKPLEPFFLVIEEINRGNAAAIFGEMFQLLDRIGPGDSGEELSGNLYKDGWSSYGVENYDLNLYIRKQDDESEIKNLESDEKSDDLKPTDYKEFVQYDALVKFTSNTAIRLPPNLYICATMNTSDQNVYTLDNAFQRRFSMKLVENDLDPKSAQYNMLIGDTKVRWGAFWTWINKRILNSRIPRAEGKCLGAWFIKGVKKDKNNTTSDYEKFPIDAFAEKVLRYLWDDVTRQNASKDFFKTKNGNIEINSLDALISAFKNPKSKTAAFSQIFDLKNSDKEELGMLKATNKQSK